jgi:hypothetical protein
MRSSDSGADDSSLLLWRSVPFSAQEPQHCEYDILNYDVYIVRQRKFGVTGGDQSGADISFGLVSMVLNFDLGQVD